MKFVKELCEYFVRITTGILIVCTIADLLYGNENIPAKTLPNILLSGAATAIITEIIMILPEPVSKKQYFFSVMLHYVLLCIVMSIMGIHFEWVSNDIIGIISMCICVAAVYAFTAFVTYFTNKADADNITKMLGEKYKKK